MKKDKQKILIIEDDLWQVEIYEEYLRRDFDVFSIDNSADALDIIDQYKISCIIADYMILGGSCISLLHEIQSYSDLSNIPVILCSNVSDSLSIENISEYGVKKILDKTNLIPKDILGIVKEVV